MYASKAHENVAVPKKSTRPTWEEYVGIEKYALTMYMLQKEAGLSFKEARATLRPVQVMENLAKEWGCSEENIYNLRRRGIEKVRKVTGDNDDEFERLLPEKLCHVY
ncbi:MAG: hypothetical protein FWD37_05310 [Methanomassiliicoccaceae archaeon]|nr:hypothetical protein [Methanomassiliicoccaceae archaeon]